MTTQLVKFPDPRLRVPATHVTDFTDPKLKECCDALRLHLKPLGAVGLAAQQLGFTLRVAAFAVEGLPDVMVNPLVIPVWPPSMVDSEEEGCVSMPGVHVVVTRPISVIAEWYDEHGGHRRGRLHDMLARVVQHECDHLDGVLITDKGSPFRSKR